ncbi:O-methyltransferase [Novosphingobium cyanobacteriorum]|uniref:Class I SAM-dependent methyltransferase n=1 Tax=Novosphingobium cyanobacteriorum TaxID=3024215 RepID=A0ABT6CJC7_9SPHN|nr:class I SAM-dependent methyltransferase [Novosphingobium cyanobacteriorum]MDF8334019.1 class I SAM-dependent methyltransferase [Novosphingobium cyanobacteriorum]
MNFTDPCVTAVFETYRQREVADQARMRELGPAGFALRDEFLLPIGEDVGAVLHALVLARRPRVILELGTSYGYSTMILADAARAVGARVISMELADYKQAFARARLQEAGLADVVDLRCGDAPALLAAETGPFDFVLLDIWKELYLPCFEAFYPKLSDEGVIAADNMIEPEHDRLKVRAYREAVRAKADLQTVLLPIGSGIELTMRWDAGNSKL